jgi:hypothetical protein
MPIHQPIIKRVLALIFILGLTLALVACGDSSGVPYGSLTDDAYASFEDISLSEKELYDRLRYQSADLLSVMIDEVVFADDIAAVSALLEEDNETSEFFNTFLDDVVNAAIFANTGYDTDPEELAELYLTQTDRMNRKVEEFVDNLYLLDATVDRLALYNEILSLNPKFSGYAQLDQVLNRYLLRIAQNYYARNILLENVDLEDSDEFVSVQDVVRYYNVNNLDRYDVNAFIVRFINQNEANAALFATSIKSDARGNWYQVPDIRITDPTQPGFVDLNDDSAVGYPHVISILTTLNLLDKAKTDRSQISISEFESYYSRYTISTTRNNGLKDIPLSDALVKAKFVEIYNLLNPAAKVEVSITGDIVGVDSDFSTLYTYEDLDTLNASLRSHAYVTLGSEDNQEDDGASNPYSARVQTFGNSRYLVFKLSDDSASQENILIEDPEDPDLKIFDTDNTEALDLYNELRDKLIEEKLTSDYVTTQIEEKYEDVDVQIFDSIVRTFFKQNYSYNGKDDNKSGNVVATVDRVDILVDDLYARAEERFGLSLSVDMLMNKYLDNQDVYTVTDAELASFNTQFEDVIRQFSADQFATNGFPASIGREQFLLIAFGASTNEQAVKELYVFPELRKQFLQDYEAHYGEGVFQVMTDLAQKQYDLFKSTRVSHLLVYFDNDGDGSPDNPQEYLDTLSPQAVTDIKRGLADLVSDVYDKLGDFKSDAEAFTRLSELFNLSGRIERGSNSVPYDLQIELEYAKYRQLGFYLKFENIGSNITNTSNFITGQSVLDPVFYDRAMFLHDFIVGDGTLPQLELPFIDSYDDYIFNNLDLITLLDDVQSDFGWHFIVTTSITKAPLALYLEESDTEGRYSFVQDDITYTAYNEGVDAEVSGSNALTLNQVTYYMVQNLTEAGATLPPVVQTAVNTYLLPLLNLYKNQFMQRELIFNLLAPGITFKDQTLNTRLAGVRDVNTNQLFSYLLSDKAYFDANYDALYGDFLALLRGE